MGHIPRYSLLFPGFTGFLRVISRYSRVIPGFGEGRLQGAQRLESQNLIKGAEGTARRRAQQRSDGWKVRASTRAPPLLSLLY